MAVVSSHFHLNRNHLQQTNFSGRQLLAKKICMIIFVSRSDKTTCLAAKTNVTG